MVAMIARCIYCGDTLQSKHRHDFKYCRCQAIFVDGGDAYFRCGGDFSQMEVLQDNKWIPFAKYMKECQVKSDAEQKLYKIQCALKEDNISLKDGVNRAFKVGVDTSKKVALGAINGMVAEAKTKNGGTTTAERRLVHAILVELRKRFEAMGS